MPIEASGQTDVGCVRSENEDRILVDTILGLFAVCDGMGGHQHGEVAAEMAIAAIRFSLHSSRDQLDASWPFGYNFDFSLDANRLATAIRVANGEVWRRASESQQNTGMGTTIAAVLVKDSLAVIGNVGDSRVYRFRNSELSQISADDSMVANLVGRGMLSPSEAATHPLRNVLTQAAGSQENVNTHLREEKLEPGDVLLLCSDGLHGVVDGAVIRSILGGGDSLERAASRLVTAATAAGAPDNVSAVLLRYS